MKNAFRILTHLLLIGIFGPLFGSTPEDRSKDISPFPSIVNAAFLLPKQDSLCAFSHRRFERGTASWYGHDFQGKLMANGEVFDMQRYTVAHKTLRLGTEVCITNRKNGQSVKATVTDRGPFVGARIVDLSWRVADELGITGLGTVEISLPPNTRKHSI